MTSLAPLTSTAVTVDIVSDIVCPWCWLGLRYFKEAAKQMPFEVELVWHPYMLDPNVPADGVPYTEYMRNKFGDGPSNKFKAMRQHLESAGPELSIDFKFSGIPMRPNTLKAHRLMRWAGGQGLATEMAEALFEAFFSDHRDVGDNIVLSEIAQQIGMDASLIAELLKSDRDSDVVTAEIAHFQKLGISGVPTFIYNRQFVVQGGQPTQAHIGALQKSAELTHQTEID